MEPHDETERLIEDLERKEIRWLEGEFATVRWARLGGELVLAWLCPHGHLLHVSEAPSAN